jgi:predicted nucleic acid-binding protein
VARLIVLDASLAIAALSADDAHHDAAVNALAGANEDELVLAATTRAEILVGPARAGGKALTAARDFADGCECPSAPRSLTMPRRSRCITARSACLMRLR